MPFIGSLGGSKLIRGSGAYHPGVGPQDTNAAFADKSTILSVTPMVVMVVGTSGSSGTNTMTGYVYYTGQTTTATASSGASTITVAAAASTTQNFIYAGCLITGAGIPANTYVTASYVFGSTTVPISNPTSSSLSSTTVAFYFVPLPGMTINSNLNYNNQSADSAISGGTTVSSINAPAGGSNNTITFTITLSQNLAGNITSNNHYTCYTPASNTASATRTTYDPFNNGAVTYVANSAISGTITSTTATGTITITPNTTGLSQGSPFVIARYSGGGHLYPGTWYVASVLNGTQVTLATTLANALAGTATTQFASYTFGNNGSPVPVWTSGGLPPGFSLNSNTGQISGSYTGYNNSRLNPDQVLGGIPGGNVQPPNLWTFTDTATDSVGQTSTRTHTIQVTVPYQFRQIITTCYTMGGYQNSVTWPYVCKTIPATDTTTDTGANLVASFNYQQGCHNWNRWFSFGASGAHCAAASNIICWNLRTETAQSSGFTASWPVSHVNDSTCQQEYYYAYCSSGTAGGAYKWNLSTETLVAGIITGTSANNNQAHSWETYGVWCEAQSYLTYATETNAARGTSSSTSNNGQYKIMQNKQPATYQWDCNSRYSNMITNTSADATGPGNVCLTGTSENQCVTGQDWGYNIGTYLAGHTVRSFRFNYATQTGFEGNSTMQWKGGGQTGTSSGDGCWRD